MPLTWRSYSRERGEVTTSRVSLRRRFRGGRAASVAEADSARPQDWQAVAAVGLSALQEGQRMAHLRDGVAILQGNDISAPGPQVKRGHGSREDLADHLAVVDLQTLPPRHLQLARVEAELVEDRRVNVGDVVPMFDGVEA